MERLSSTGAVFRARITPAEVRAKIEEDKAKVAAKPGEKVVESKRPKREKPTNENSSAADEETEDRKAEPKPKKRGAKPAFVPHVHVDFEMPTLAQVAKFVRREAAKGTKALTATEIRRRFKVPGKIPMNSRLHQLEVRGFGKFEKVGKSNTLILDIEAITSGKAAVTDDTELKETVKKERKARKKSEEPTPPEATAGDQTEEPAQPGEEPEPEEAPV